MATGGLNIRSRTSGILSLAGLTQYQTKIKKKVKIAYGLAVKQATKETILTICKHIRCPPVPA